jgi:hypothetical protein
MPQAHDLSLGGTVVAGAADRGHHFSKPILDRLVLVEGHGVEGDAHAGAFVWHRYLARLSSRQFGILNGNRKFRAGRRKVHGRTLIGHDTLRSIEGIQGTSCEVDVLGRDVRHSHHHGRHLPGRGRPPSPGRAGAARPAIASALQLTEPECPRSNRLPSGRPMGLTNSSYSRCCTLAPLSADCR